MKSDKEGLEESAVKYFLEAYPRKLRILEHSDKPDFILLDEDGQSKIGVEITHLYFDKNEAKMLLGRTREVEHGVMKAIDLINELNKLLEQKCNKIVAYKKHQSLFLVIRVTSPIFDITTFDAYENSIICPENNYDEIWLLLDDNDKNTRWTELKAICPKC